MSGSEQTRPKKISGTVVMTKKTLNNFFFLEIEITMNLGRRRVESRREFIDYFTCVKTADRYTAVQLFSSLCLSKTHITNF